MPGHQDRGVQGKTEMFSAASWKFEIRGGHWGVTKEDLSAPAAAKIMKPLNVLKAPGGRRLTCPHPAVSMQGLLLYRSPAHSSIAYESCIHAGG